MKKALAFLKKYPAYNASIHAIGGLGIGILIASSVSGNYTLLLGLTLIIVSLLGHLYAWFA